MSTSYPIRPLAEIADRVDYGLTASAVLDRDAGPRFLRITDIVPAQLNWASVPFCVLSSEKDREKFSLLPGDIVIARTGATVGYSKLITDEVDAVFASYLVRVRVNSECNARYVSYVVGSEDYKEFIRSNAGGAAQPNANARVLTSYGVPLPTLGAQRKIAAILSAYDDLIENNNRRIQLLEEMAQRIYREWFVDFRYPGHEAVPLVDSEVGLLPEGWDVEPLSSICERITDGAHASPETTSAGKPMASVKDMTTRKLALDKCRLIALEDYEALIRQDCNPKVNDVLIAKDGSYLKHVFVVRESHDVVILSSIALLRPNERIQSDVLALCLQQQGTKERLKAFVSGAAIPRIVLKSFRVFSLVVPPIGLQKTLVDTVQPMLSMAFQLDSANERLRQSRDLLLPRLISGEVDVSDLDIAVPEAVV